MGASLFFLLLDSSTFRSPDGGKEMDLSSNHRGKLKEIKRFPFLRQVIPRVPERVFLGWSTTTSKFEISNGHNWGAIWSNRDETLSSHTAMIWSIFWEGCHGAWPM